MDRFIRITLVAVALLAGGVAGATLPSPDSRNEFTAGGETQFTFSFKVYEASSIEVFLNGSKQNLGYSVAINANQNTTPGGTVTFYVAPTAGTTVRIQRTVPMTQLLDLNPSSYPAKSIAMAFDRETMRAQQLERRISDHETTSAAIAAAANSSTPVIAQGHVHPRTLEDWFSDAINVMGFIPPALHAGIRARTETTDLTPYISLAIAGAGPGIVYFPPGRYYHSGITLTGATQIVGAGWDYNAGGTTLFNTSSTNPNISITAPATIGARVSNIHLRGNGDIVPTTAGAGVYVHSEGDNLLDRVYVTFAKHGVELYGHTSALTIRGCRFQSNIYDGVYGRSEAAHQLNSILITGSESTYNGRHGVNVWANHLGIVDSTIQGNSGAGIYLNADDMSTANASVVSVRIRGNYFEANRLGAIKALTTDAPPIYHYLQGVWITENFITEPHALSTTVTGAIDLDCGRGGGNRCFSGSYSYDGVVVADNYVGLMTSIAFVDFHGVHGRRTVLTPFFGSYSPLTSFSAQYKDLGSVFVRDAAYRSSAMAPTDSADYTGQVHFHTGTGTWTRSRSAGLGASDWLSGSSPVLQIPLDPELIVSPDGLDNAPTWYATTPMVTANADGVADAVFVGTGVNASLNQGYSGVTAGESYLFAFDAKNNGGTVAALQVDDATSNTAIVNAASYFSQMNGSTYTRIVMSFQVPSGCTSLKVYPVSSPSLAGATNVLIKAVSLKKLSVGFARFATSSAVIASGQQTVAVALTPYQFTAAPSCTVTGSTANRAYKATTTALLLTIDAGAVLGGDETVQFTCIGQ